MDLELNIDVFAALLRESKVFYSKNLDLYYEKCSFLINVAFFLKEIGAVFSI